MNLVLTNPFTFISVDQEEAALCSSSPYIGKETSAQLLESSPCYAKGQRPGKYSKECVQSVFDSAGCNSQGTAYPYNEANTKAISYDKNGNPLSVGGIANIVYGMYNTATLGQDANGQPLEISDWDTASMACLGTHKTSVCDKYDKINGPLGADCLNYLWQNSGAADQLPFGIGSTYTGSTASASLQAKRGNRYCTTGGSMAPMDEKGNVNQAAVAQAQAKGGVASVSQFYDRISKKANDNTLPDEDRSPFVEQCYGVSLETRKAEVGVNLEDKAGKTIYRMWTGKPTDYGSINIPKDYRISLIINPKGAVSAWANVFRFSSTNGDMNGFGSRMPCMYFWPGTTRLHIPIGDIRDANYYIDPGTDLPLNQDSYISIVTKGDKITITINGQQYNYNQLTPGGRPSGPANISSPDRFYVPVNADVKNLTVGGGGYQSVIDYNPGRTKTSFMPPPPPPTTRCVTALNDNIDLPGADLKSFILPNKDYNLCQKACMDEPSCKAWAYAKSDGRCWLKGDGYWQSGNANRITGKIGLVNGSKCPVIAPILQERRGVISGPSDGLDYPGGDYTHSYSASPTVCQQRCIDDKQCKVWAYNKGNGECWLKNTITNKDSRSWVISGVIGNVTS